MKNKLKKKCYTYKLKIINKEYALMGWDFGKEPILLKEILNSGSFYSMIKF